MKALDTKTMAAQMTAKPRYHLASLETLMEQVNEIDRLSVTSLPETRRLPSAEGFAECKISSTRQSYTLPSAYQKALSKKSTLGKDWLCRVPDYRHSANPPLPSATRAALGKQPHVCAAHARRARYPSRPLLFVECPQGHTRQTPLCRVPRSGHSAKTITCAARDRYPVATNVTPLRRSLPLSFAECRLGHSSKIC